MVVKDTFLYNTSFQNGTKKTDSFNFITKIKGVENGYSYVEIKRKIKKRETK